MILGTRSLRSLLSGAILVLLPAIGASAEDPTKPRITLTVTRIRGVEYSAKELEGEFKGKEVRFVVLACDAVIDNQTGKDLTVENFQKAANDMTYKRKGLVGPTPLGDKPRPSPCGTLVTSNGTGYDVSVPYFCAKAYPYPAK